MNDEPTNLTLEQLEQRLHRQPFSPLFARLAYEYLNQNRVEEAKQLCAKGLGLYPNYSTAQLILELCYRLESAEVITSPDFISDETQSSSTDISENRSEEIVSTQNDIDVIDETEVQNSKPILQVSSELNVDEETLKEVQNISQTESIAGIEELQEIEKSEPVLDSSPVEQFETTNKLHPDGVFISEPPDEVSGNAINSRLTGDIFENENVRGTNDEVDLTTAEIALEFPPPPESISVEETLHGDSENILTPQTDSIEKIDEVNINELDIIDADKTIQVAEDTNKNIRDHTRPIISKTLAEIYAAQGEYREAIETYSLLIKIRPTQKDEISIRIRELEEELSKTRSEQD
ncbi:MAG: hypothetical protein HZB59_12130 [Ignavibacteriales bacterium]|nr:hypothetical protein [Ignavibacteriales bacterium]